MSRYSPDFKKEVIEKVLSRKGKRIDEIGSECGVPREFCREIGIREITHHQLRNTHITLSILDGVSLGVVKDNVGHASLITTNQYYNSSGINMTGQTDKLSIRVPKEDLGEIIPLVKVK